MRRSITSVTWNSLANVTDIGIRFVRMVLLARLLPHEMFGTYSFASSIVVVSGVAVGFGMGGAFLHRAPETEDEEQAAAVHFTLRVTFTLIWALLLGAGTMLFVSGPRRTALLLLTATTAGLELTQIPRLILIRRVVHRRLALLQVLNSFLTTAIALGLAWRGMTLWALLATDVVTLLLTLIVLYVWRPVWRPRLTWAPSEMKYFLRFGRQNFLATILMRALDQIDDMWTGAVLGDRLLGFYSRAYRFATYPRSILATPVYQVVRGTYAELKGDRRRLSQMFFRANALLVRSGFLLAGLLALVAPEFIRLLLTVEWLPMLDAFRLMLVFTLLDPIKLSISEVFIAVGRPEKVVQARAIQLAVMVIGLFLLGPWLGIAGVALAVDVMLVVGIAILLWRVRRYVDFSLKRLFAVPALALTLGMLLGRGVIEIPGTRGSDWRTGFFKAIVFSLVYGGVLLGLERDVLLQVSHLLRKRLLNLKKRTLNSPS